MEPERITSIFKEANFSIHPIVLISNSLFTPSKSINLKDISSKELKKILIDAKKRKRKREKLRTLETDFDEPLKGKLLIQMFEKSSLRTRLSFYLAIKQLGGGTITLRSNELHLGEGGESLEDTAKIIVPIKAKIILLSI